MAGLATTLGSGAMTNSLEEVLEAKVILVIGSNTTWNHPVFGSLLKQAVKLRGAKLIVCDPRRIDLVDFADIWLQQRNGSDVALLMGLQHIILREGWEAAQYIKERTEGYDEYLKALEFYTPAKVAELTGVAPDDLLAAAKLFATSGVGALYYCMGITQHSHGVDNVKACVNLQLITGNLGVAGGGVNPLRGQNNVQGASDAGLIPMMLPDYQPVDSPEVRARFEQAWQLAPGTLDDRPGLTVVEVMHAIARGEVRGMYIQGENPAMSDPDANHARAALAALEHLVVQDIFPTETACLADVILPAGAFPEKTGSFTNTDRLVQIGRQALEPPGDARADLWIIQQIARRLGLAWDYADAGQVFDEMRSVMPSIAGISRQRLEREGAVTYPCAHEGDPGEAVVFTREFPRAGGKARIVPVDIVPAAERPDAQYPLVLITGRQLEHWHTGSMTRRAGVLDAIEPDPTALLHPLELAAAGVRAGEAITLETRRGRVALWARADDGMPRGAVFAAFAYCEAAINELTHDALDPFAKIPEVKYCAVRVRAGGTPRPAGSYGGGQLLAEPAPGAAAAP